MKKIMKILSITMILCMVLTSFCFADALDEAGVKVETRQLEGGGGDLANAVLGTLRTIGIFISVGMAIFLGIKYVGASPEGKSELKKQLGVYVLGIVLILGASLIVGAVADMVSNV